MGCISWTIASVYGLQDLDIYWAHEVHLWVVTPDLQIDNVYGLHDLDVLDHMKSICGSRLLIYR